MSNEFNGTTIAAELNELLRLRNTPIGIKAFKDKDCLSEIPKLRFPNEKLNICQILAQAIQNGFTIGFTAEHCDGFQCKSICGLIPKSEDFMNGAFFKGIWFENEEACRAHQESLHTSPEYQAFAASPLRSGRFIPDVCMITGTPGQMFILLSGFLHGEYKAVNTRFVGESSCSEGWVRTLATGEPSLVTPCFAELRYAGYRDEEMILTMTSADLQKAIEGMKKLSASGLRYPVSSYSCQCDPSIGLKKSYK